MVERSVAGVDTGTHGLDAAVHLSRRCPGPLAHQPPLPVRVPGLACDVTIPPGEEPASRQMDGPYLRSSNQLTQRRAQPRTGNLIIIHSQGPGAATLGVQPTKWPFGRPVRLTLNDELL